MTIRIAEHPRPDHFLLHLSDTHLLGADSHHPDGQLYGRVDSETHLRELFDELEASAGRPEAIIFTGDLADKGEPDAYEKLRSIVEPAAALAATGETLPVFTDSPSETDSAQSGPICRQP